MSQRHPSIVYGLRAARLFVYGEVAQVEPGGGVRGFLGVRAVVIGRRS